MMISDDWNGVILGRGLHPIHCSPALSGRVRQWCH